VTPDAAEWVVRWPTLGFLGTEWIEAHCVVPDGIDRGAPFELYVWQLWCTVNHYRVVPDAKPAFDRKRDGSRVAPRSAFHHRRSLVVGPQKYGKGPWSAATIGLEAVGPAIFAGFAGVDDGYACSDWGCGCGFEYPYQPGEPMGRPWPTSTIQILATSEDQVGNIYRPLQEMARHGALGERMRVGEEFIRLPNNGRIDPVTSSANSRLGNPITYAVQDETGLYTRSNRLLQAAQTMRRGLAGMGGRSLGTTNAPDPIENSDAQITLESRREDIFRFFREPPKHLSYRNKRERRKIHQVVYEGAEHVDLDSIEAEAAELLETDPEQAERFFGNRRVQGKGSWMPDGTWDQQESLRRPHLEVVGDRRLTVCAGFDGSDVDDWTAIRLETLDRFQFTPTYGPDDRPTIWNPAEWGGRIPRSEVHAAWDELHRRFRIVRAYCDRRGWETEVDVTWPGLFGDEVMVGWETYRPRPMHDALKRVVNDLTSGELTHDGCAVTGLHVGNARKVAQPGDRYILGKPSQHQKIDAAMAAVLAHEATCDAVAAGLGAEQEQYAYTA
jgi:hypothetical protein